MMIGFHGNINLMTNEQKLDKIRECVDGYFKDVAKYPIETIMVDNDIGSAGYGWMTEIEVHLGAKNDE